MADTTAPSHTWDDLDTTGLNRPDHNIWPGVAARDPLGLRQWLSDIGFAEGILVPGHADGEVEHSEMLWPEGGRVMVHSLGEKDGMVATAGIHNLYVVTGDPEAVHERAVALGAPMVRPMKEEDYGSLGFTVTDPEGNYWSFGTYAGEYPSTSTDDTTHPSKEQP